MSINSAVFEPDAADYDQLVGPFESGYFDPLTGFNDIQNITFLDPYPSSDLAHYPVGPVPYHICSPVPLEQSYNSSQHHLLVPCNNDPLALTSSSSSPFPSSTDKRQKCCFQDYRYDDDYYLTGGYLDEYSCGENKVNATKKSQSPSPQSIAARQRRKKISDKTRELGTLIPGGNRMTTAEMFQAASKYVNYLRAQVAVLDFMARTFSQGSEEYVESSQPHLHALLVCPKIQEKLYVEEKCLVPQQIIKDLMQQQPLPSQPNSL